MRYDAYRDTLIEHDNPWAVGRRFEHYLRADDLYTGIIDYGDRIGAPHSEQQLDAIRDEVRRQETQWRTEPRPSTWLDAAVQVAHRRLDDLQNEGIALIYATPGTPNRLAEAGFRDKTRYIQHAHTGEDGRTTVYDTPAELYSSYDELLSAAAGAAPILSSVPEGITEQLQAFERDHSILHRDLSTITGLKEALRTGSPYTIRSHHHPGDSTAHITRGWNAPTRDADGITLTHTRQRRTQSSGT
ncbi:hypothetical protein [Nocardia acidivorans]|uniref:hypothetical protein n=1 Tax=Nocardia acidivorans TaxID=404580 RepID=UPI0012F932D3|nr:hypothetical protein [Nocardia acidivorans]